MLSPEIIKKIKKIHIKSGRLVNTMMAGQYKSVFRGSGIEFEEVREYSPGDEVQSIDWKVTARMGQPYVKRYKEERELVMMLLIDMSASGQFGTQENLKTESAAEIASILAFNAIRNNDRVGAILFTNEVEKYIPPRKGASHVWRVIKEFFTFTPNYKGTDVEAAVQYLGHVCRKKTVSFLISDFLPGIMVQDYARKLKITAKKHELISIMLTDPGEFILPDAGLCAIEDFETGELIFIDASDKKTRAGFTQLKNRERQTTLETIQNCGVDVIQISTVEPAADALTRYFRFREIHRSRAIK
ncbi:DUF58 domain-containing protein [Desulfococcaceae bacterium HSG9]|nr:DUF58 domain-containing protein [Desulfococcaceae bacterium HSG9]